jgi:hypothetical protein
VIGLFAPNKQIASINMLVLLVYTTNLPVQLTLIPFFEAATRLLKIDALGKSLMNKMNALCDKLGYFDFSIL